MKPMNKWIRMIGIAGMVLLIAGCWIGLFVAPAERFMGDVQRIMYVHVPTAWNAMLGYTFAFVFAIVSLWTAKPKWDSAVTGIIEVSLLLNALLLIQGSIWARKTWGVWWDWDVRLTTSLIMLLLFAGVLALRSFVPDPDRKATWTSVATIVAYVDVPLVYFCVRWWRSLHQVQSSPETVSSSMILPLRMNAFALLFLGIWMVVYRARLETMKREQEQVAEPDRLAPVGGIEDV